LSIYFLELIFKKQNQEIFAEIVGPTGRKAIQFHLNLSKLGFLNFRAQVQKLIYILINK
jgi:hypothetical protein